MVYIRLPTWKSAINPSTKHTFNQEGNFTPLQKMMLARNRIWGNIVGGNDRSGFKEVSKPTKGKAQLSQYEFSRLNLMYPFIHRWERRNKIKDKYQERKLRIFMRGMKIGQSKGVGKSMSAMSVFEQGGKDKKATDAEAGQKAAESEFK